MRRHVALLLGLTIAGCAEQAPTSPTATPTPSMVAPQALRANLSSSSSVWSKQITGETGTGALYAFFVPDNWNGDVVYYAHGIVDAALPIALPTGDGFPDVRDALGALGYAVAYSSFSENGWAVKDGVESTHKLRGIFADKVGKPKRSFLMGTSMGGLVAQSLAENYSKEYDGTLAMCAPLGGAIDEVNYIANVRVLFDALYPGVIPGDVLHVPAGIDLNTQVLGPAQGAVMANPTGLGIIARIRQTPLAGADGTELATSLLYALAYDVRGIDDFLGRTHGHSIFDNSHTLYVAAADGLLDAGTLAAVNAAVGRFTATKDAIKYLDKYYVPDGELDAPTITMHTTRDPLVPFFHEAEFAQVVSKEHDSARLLQRSFDRYGHCAFSTTEMVDAFQTLSGWVKTGQRPAN
jgi:pimeloyl-ACP methyl ester carboxylesterase